MASDYAKICTENRRRYGTDIGRFGSMFWADLYADQTHFIYEVLQNAEDVGATSVRFHLTKTDLQINHNGRPFNADDVRGVCGIGESTKDEAQIGRFGIGFKSVYAFTKRPEIYSGSESFAIEGYVLPVPVARHPQCAGGETLIVIPFGDGAAELQKKIKQIEGGLRNIGVRTLLFTRHIEKISWTLPDQASGSCHRKLLDENGRVSDENDWVRRISVSAKGPDASSEEMWLIFSKPVSDNGVTMGNAEIAFKVSRESKPTKYAAQALEKSYLVAFFPTDLETHLGFLVQGPYITTLARDNVKRDNAWNQHCVSETAALLIEALRWLRDRDALTVEVLECLPLYAADFSEGAFFHPLFETTKNAIASERLLPRFGGGYVSAKQAMLARAHGLQEIFAPAQLADLSGKSGEEIFWLSADIKEHSTADIWRYLRNELGIAGHDRTSLLPKLGKEFLEQQPDSWVRKLYKFLEEASTSERAYPLVRLADGSHVPANHEPKVFLPGKVETNFRTVRASVCDTEDSHKFLQSLGLGEPDPVDYVIQNVLEKYRKNAESVKFDESAYEADIKAILRAYSTDSQSQKEKLVTELCNTPFVRVQSAKDGSHSMMKPECAYIPTDTLSKLFFGVPGVFFVDNSRRYLQGEKIRDLLIACGSTRYLHPESTDETGYTWQEIEEIKRAAGLSAGTGWCKNNHGLRGLDALLQHFQKLSIYERKSRAELLWKALTDLYDRNAGVFSAEYRWSYSHAREKKSIDAFFVRALNHAKWVSDTNSDLDFPKSVLFDDLGWDGNELLQSKIRFKLPVTPALLQVAQEADVDPESLDFVLSLLKGQSLNVEQKEQLKKAFGRGSQTDAESMRAPHSNAVEYSQQGADAQPVTGISESHAQPRHDRLHHGSPGSGGGRTRFHSYVEVLPDNADVDSENSGLDHSTRMNLEEQAIAHILAEEPDLQRMPQGNHGFDLAEYQNGRQIRWVEVKSMSGGWNSPVTMSRTQFECAQKHGEAYWLYVVEHADDDQKTTIRKIQDPAGKAQNFAFDAGWLDIAE